MNDFKKFFEAEINFTNVIHNTFSVGTSWVLLVVLAILGLGAIVGVISLIVSVAKSNLWKWLKITLYVVIPLAFLVLLHFGGSWGYMTIKSLGGLNLK